MIQKSTFEFLLKLKENNNREWFQENKHLYEGAKENMLELIENALQGMKKFDTSLMDLESKKCMYRIYRDVRFSKEKLPYKTNMGASITSGGRNSKRAGYYIHLQPGNESFVGGGIYMPESAHLKAIRQEIAYNSAGFLKIIEQKKFNATFGELWGEKMKNAPREYDKDHPAIELLKHKHYIFAVDFTDQEVLSADFEKKIIEALKILHPFIDFLNHAISEV